MAATAEPAASARRRPGLLPSALRLPAAAGAMVFAVAVGTTQLALQVTNREADRRLAQLGEVYLDGLAASLRAGLETRDAIYVTERMALAFAEQQGIAERTLFAFTPDGMLLARHGDPGKPADQAAALGANSWRLDPGSGTAWVSRAVEGTQGPAGRVVAALDVSPILLARTRLAWGIVLLDLLLAAVAALLTWAVLQRLGRPLRILVEALSGAARQVPVPLPEVVVARADPRSAAVLRAYNSMAEGMRERERLTTELAEREQAAALGRLAATIAHEVRNPLGGLGTAVSTLRRFGDDREVREESLAFLDRGIATLDRIVTSTLTLYRAEEDRALLRSDLEDLAFLARPAAERRGIALALSVDLPGGEIAPGAGGIRQVLLNLLLNACEATPPGGTVELRAWQAGAELVCEIADTGPGLDPEQGRRLTGGGAGTLPRKGLGLGVVVGLLGTLDARASVTERPGGGTTIRLAIPAGGRA
jgi:two-component system OmpR family sensor kinase